MRLSSALAIYALFWVMGFFLVLPFRLQARGGDEEARVRGAADGAPPRFSLPRTAGWTTLVSGLLFGLFLLNYRYGWLTPDRLDLVPASLLAL